MTTTIRCGLIGEHIDASRFGAAMRAVGAVSRVDVAFENIDAARIDGFDFPARVRDLADAGWTGVTVTHPFKVEAMGLADRRFGAPARLASANTLLFRDGIEATNTDYSGFLGAWAERMGDASPGRVAMAGAGGVARSVAAALDELGAVEIAVWDTRAGAAAALAAEVGGAVRRAAPEEAPGLIAAADGLVNATPLGMAAHPGVAFAPSALGRQSWLFDAVYGPEETAQADAARAAGLVAVTGRDLFRHMLLGSFEAYSGVAPDRTEALALIQTLLETR